MSKKEKRYGSGFELQYVKKEKRCGSGFELQYIKGIKTLWRLFLYYEAVSNCDLHTA
jgi:hypothetical protein